MNPALTTPPTTDPGLILRYRDRNFAAELIAAGLLHLDFFTWLSENGPVTEEDIISHFKLAARPTDVFLTLCRASGFLSTSAESGETSISDLGREHLVKGSPYFLGPYYEPLRDTPVTHDFLRVLRTGKPANRDEGEDGANWHDAMLDETFARPFTELMNCRGLACGQALANALSPLLEDKKSILDIGGGPGIYSATMVAAHPNMKAVILEQPPVDSIAKKEIEKHGLENHIDIVPGNMFTCDWPTGHDVILFSNLLHDWDFPEIEILIQKAAEALPKDGLLIIHEVFINDDKTGPLPAAEYSALLMNICEGKCYTHREYAEILDRTGFTVGPYSDTIADRGYMTALKK